MMFEDFYKQAHARDQAMTDNLVKSMTDHKTDTAVLVTGGFHSPGMAEKLERAGFTVISFTPKIEKIDTSKGSAYLSVFTQEKTPLEKMFKGEKLFLAQNPTGGLNSAPAELSAGVAVANVKNGSRLSEIEQDVQRVVAELSRLGLSPVDLRAPKVDIQESGDNLLVTVEITQDGNTRQVRYTVTFDKEGAYYKVDAAEVLGIRGEVVEFAREIAPTSAEDMVARVNNLFDLGHSEAIAETPILSGLPGMALAEILWVLNLHQRRNIDRTDLAARIVKLELLRQISLVAEAGRWVVNATAAQALLGSKSSEVTELSQTEGGMGSEISKAVAHYVLNHNLNGTDRLGMLNLGYRPGVFRSLNQSYYRNFILKPFLKDLLKRDPTAEEIETVLKEALRRETNPVNILKEIHSYPDFPQWVQGMSLRHDLILLRGFAIGIESGVQVFQSNEERQQIIAALEHVGPPRVGDPDKRRQSYSDLGFDEQARVLFEFEILPTVKRFVDKHNEKEAPQEVKSLPHEVPVPPGKPSFLSDDDFLAQHPIYDAGILRDFKKATEGQTIGVLNEKVREQAARTGKQIHAVMARLTPGAIGLGRIYRLQKMIFEKTGKLLSLEEIMRMPIAQLLLQIGHALPVEELEDGNQARPVDNNFDFTDEIGEDQLRVVSINEGRLLDIDGVQDGDLGVIGDVQGNFDETLQTLVKTGFVDANGNWIAGNKVLVFAGDLIDGGDKPWEVLSFLYNLSRQAEQSGGRVVVVRGNHEDLMLGALAGDSRRKEIWLRNHGDNTLRALLGNEQLDTATLADMPSEKLMAELRSQHSDFDEVLSWMNSFPYAVRISKEILVVHASPDPGANQFEDMGKTESSRLRMMWDRKWTQKGKSYIANLPRRKADWRVNFIVYGHSMEKQVNDEYAQGRIDLMKTGVFNVNVLPRKAPKGGAQGVLLFKFKAGKVIGSQARYGSNGFDLNTVKFPTDAKPVRNTWFSSSVVGYGFFVIVAGLLLTFFGVDLETLSSPLKSLLLIAAVPLSMVTTSTLGVAALFELSARRKDPKVWAKKHGVQEGSAQYNTYMESAESIAAAGRAAAAAGKSVTWAEIKEQSRLNIQYLMGLFKRQGQPAQGPTAEETPTVVSTILETMPDAKKGTFSAADVFGAITNTGSNLQGMAKNAVQGMSEQTRRRVSHQSGALSWLMEVSQIDTNAVALLPLPSTLMGRGDLDQIVDNALAMHKKAVFYVEAGVNVPGAFMRYIESKDDRVELIRLSAGVKLFDNQALMMVVLEQNAPHNAPNVQPYLPDEYTANATGVKDEKRFGDKSVLPMSLVLMFKRMIELANFIATQA
ncbi:MAG: metallophosphoesterase [Elusimicrobia bacterium]|nr:metallophosphoesterase [Elusimicrobiota bacterium]